MEVDRFLVVDGWDGGIDKVTANLRQTFYICKTPAARWIVSCNSWLYEKWTASVGKATRFWKDGCATVPNHNRALSPLALLHFLTGIFHRSLLKPIVRLSQMLFPWFPVSHLSNRHFFLLTANQLPAAFSSYVGEKKHTQYGASRCGCI